MYESIAGFFSNEKLSRTLQICNAFNDWKSTISHANWQCLTKKKRFFFFFFFYFICNALHLLEVLLKEIKKIRCQFEWWNRDLILLNINPCVYGLNVILIKEPCLLSSHPTTGGSGGMQFYVCSMAIFNLWQTWTIQFRCESLYMYTIDRK